jgi:hypothetical protein
MKVRTGFRKSHVRRSAAPHCGIDATTFTRLLAVDLMQIQRVSEIGSPIGCVKVACTPDLAAVSVFGSGLPSFVDFAGFGAPNKPAPGI